MSHRARPVDRKPAKPKRPRKVKLKALATMSRTAIDPSAPWPFPTTPPRPEPKPPAPKGMRYIDAKGVERVYSFKERRP